MPPIDTEKLVLPKPAPGITKPSSAGSSLSWKAKFRAAFRGMKLGVRGQASFFVHFFFAAMVVAAAVVLRVGWAAWCILLLCIGMVLAAELFNSAVETLFRGLDEKSKARCYSCLDISAGAVLLASITAAVVGAIIFLYRLAELFDWPLF